MLPKSEGVKGGERGEGLGGRGDREWEECIKSHRRFNRGEGGRGVKRGEYIQAHQHTVCFPSLKELKGARTRKWEKNSRFVEGVGGGGGGRWSEED